MDLAEKQLREGTASSQVITHYLKLGSTKERIEKEILEKMCIRDRNYDTEFIKYIDREMTAYIDKCEKRMLSGFSILKKHIADYKGRWLEKIDKSQYEKDVCELIDSLNNGEESAMRTSLRKTLRAVSEVKEFYISQS